jgi:hypothetical protein
MAIVTGKWREDLLRSNEGKKERRDEKSRLAVLNPKFVISTLGPSSCKLPSQPLPLCVGKKKARLRRCTPKGPSYSESLPHFHQMTKSMGKHAFQGRS